MIAVIFDCPFCGRENEITTKLENEFDYLKQDEIKELGCECQECEKEIGLEMLLSVQEVRYVYDNLLPKQTNRAKVWQDQSPNPCGYVAMRAQPTSHRRGKLYLHAT